MLSDSDKYRKTRSSRDEPLSRSEKVPVVVGEGTYGCVVNPSLQCEDGHHPDTYDHTVTKIMDSGDAADEYEELSKIASIDGIERYVLKLPHKCVPDLSRRFDKTVRKCKGKRIMRNFKTPDKYKLLIMEDGGADLYNVLRTVLPKMNFADICRFLTAIRELIEALVFFRNNMIIHHDIKQENIVYNVNTGSMKFIDFGHQEDPPCVLFSMSVRSLVTGNPFPCSPSPILMIFGGVQLPWGGGHPPNYTA